MKLSLGRNDHPGKAALLAWSEGEIPWWRAWSAWRIGRHVSSCWQCRGEISEMEAIICAVSLDIQDLPEPTRVDIARAWWRLREATRQLEATPAPKRLRLLRPGWALGAAVLVATVGLAFVTTSTWQLLFPPPASEKPRPTAPRAPIAARMPARDFAPPPGMVPLTGLPAPLPSGPGNDELIATEIQAVAALHRSRFCLNAGITVRRAGSGLEVTGMVQSADERDRITGILAGIGAPGVVRIHLTEPSSILEGISATPTTQAEPPAPKPGTPPIGHWLGENLGNRGRLNEREIFNLMNSLVLESEQVSSEAWAIRHLAGQFPEPLTRRIGPELAEQLHQMVDDHSIALANGLQRLRSRLDQMSGAPASQAAGPARPDEAWQTRVLALQRQVEEVVRQLLLAFSAEAGNGSAPDFSALLIRLNEQSRQCLAATSDLRTGLRSRTASAR